MNTTTISKFLDKQGSTVYDNRMDRWVKEMIGFQLTLREHDLDLIRKRKLNDKYQPELHDFHEWMQSTYFSVERRQAVYFNNIDFLQRMQCISLFQILDTTLLVYQRSGDIEKMEDDHRFFVEIIDRYHVYIDKIIITYGSLHKTVK